MTLCSKCGNAGRLEAFGLCKPCYMSHWRKNNRAKANQYDRKWIESHKEEKKESNKRWREKNKSRVKQTQREWLDRWLSIPENRAKRSETWKRWYSENKDRRRLYYAFRRALELGAAGSFTDEQITDMLHRLSRVNQAKRGQVWISHRSRHASDSARIERYQ